MALAERTLPAIISFQVDPCWKAIIHQEFHVFSLETLNYHQSKILNKKFDYKFSISHGWLDKAQYLQPPFMHEKTLNIKKMLVGLILLWALGILQFGAGETFHHGKQSRGLNDFLKVFFARPGSNRSIKQEQENSLGNHLGVWDFSF